MSGTRTPDGEHREDPLWYKDAPGRQLAQLEKEALPDFLGTRRWFAAEGGEIERVEVAAQAEFCDNGLMTLLRVHMADAPSEENGPQLYFLPLALAWEEGAEDGVSVFMPHVLAKLRRRARMGLLFDALADERFCRRVVEAIRKDTDVEIGEGRVRFSGTDDFDGLVGEEPFSELTVRRAEVEQTNSSVILGERLILKVYRRLQKGKNPDLEVGRYLTETVHFENTPPLVGAFEYSGPDGEPTTLGLLQGFVENQGDGWSYVLDYLGRYLEDAGLDKSEVDGLFSAFAYYQMPTLSVGEYLGIRPRYSDATSMGGSSFVSHLFHAAAIAAGLCEVALITYGSTQRSGGGRLVTGSEADPYEAPYNPRYPVSMYALAASRHMHEYGTTREQLAEVAVAGRRWAKLNPKAFMREDLTVEDVLASRMVSSPLSVRDCCLVTDGGGAAIVTSPERARDLEKSPVYLLGAGEAHWHRNISQMPDLTVSAAAESGPRAYAMAGVGPEDVDVAMLYDAFSIGTVLFLEDLGFCDKGEGDVFVSGGRISPGGELAVNTSGGGLSYNHPGMYGLLLIVEAVRQLRGECGDRQVENANIALVHGNGGVLSSQVTALLGSERAL